MLSIPYTLLVESMKNIIREYSTRGEPRSGDVPFRRDPLERELIEAYPYQNWTRSWDSVEMHVVTYIRNEGVRLSDGLR